MDVLYMKNTQKRIYESIMKNFKNSFNKHINEQMSNKQLDWVRAAMDYFNIDKKEASFLWNFWDMVPDVAFDIDDEDSLGNCVSVLELLLMCAWCLIDDGFGKDMYKELGLKRYRGKNLYDYYFFDMWNNDTDDATVDRLQATKEYIKNNPKKWEKLYNIVKTHKDDFTDDSIEELAYNLPD